MPRRTYADACGAAHGLDLVGERWALLVVRELLLGPKRYRDLRADLPGISTNALAARLDELAQAGIVVRRQLPPPVGAGVYELTAWGRELEPVVCQLGRWAARSPEHRRDLHLSATSFALSLRTNFDAERAAGVRTEIALRLGDDELSARVADGRLTVDRRPPVDPVATVAAASPSALAAVVYGGRDLAEAAAAGDVDVEGDRDAAARFLSLFTLPPPAG